MSSISFVPRSVKRRKLETLSMQDQVSPNLVDSKETPAGARLASEDYEKATHARAISSDLVSDLNRSGEGGRSQRDSTNAVKVLKGPDLEDLAFLVWLSLSDYALWSDVDLRRKIHSAYQSLDYMEERRTSIPHDDELGYIPLAYLRRHSPIFHVVSSSANLVDQPETVYVKAIRAHANRLVDVRLIVSSDGTSLHAANYWSKQPSSPTGHEIRRKTASSALDSFGKFDWEQLTVYVENIPNQYRSLPGVAKLVVSLLPPSSEAHLAKVQNVFFPSHHNDKPGSVPICKGFALVILSDTKDLQFLLETWPWDVRQQNSKDEKEHLHTPLEKEARKFGLRCLSKARWEGLKAEYILYRQQLVEELNVENAAQQQLSRATSSVRPEQKAAFEPEHEAADAGKVESSTPSTIYANSRFPSGCLVFVRNVHSETNKTTLRALFSQAWQTTNGPPPASGADGVDYVDYLKGLDSCHIRLRSQAHAKHFVQHFSTHPTVQTSGLDGVGMLLHTPIQERAKSEAMVPELVSGKREELYWEKIPEKVRRQAVGKALGELDGSEGRYSNMTNEGANSKRKNWRKEQK